MRATTASEAFESLAVGMRAVSGRLHPDAASKVADALQVAISQTDDPYALSALSQGLKAVSRRLDPASAAGHEGRATVSRYLDATAASKAADTLLAAMSKTTNPIAYKLLWQGLWAVSGRLDATASVKVAEALVAAMGKTNDLNDPSELSKGLQEVSERLTTPDLVILLRHPLAAGPCQRALLDVLGRRTRREFRNTWHFLDRARSSDVDLVPPPLAAGSAH
jgi:hypothetical protein